MSVLSRIKRSVLDREKKQLHKYFERYCNYAFVDNLCESYEQYEASITRLYHTVEKGLTYENYRPGFGIENINTLIASLEKYSREYDINAMFYRTALCVLQEYVKKNREFGYTNDVIDNKLSRLPGTPNDLGGVIDVKITEEAVKEMNYAELMRNRHSIRHFADSEVMLDTIVQALEIAQYTPSACNRQGWNAYVIQNKEKIRQVLKNQNGNRGFGDEIDKLLLIAFDLRYSNRDREIFQAFIDGGMYSANVLNALYYEGIGAVPLSASLTENQERNIRKIIGMNQAEVFVLFVGLGNYPDKCLTTRSVRRNARYTVV